MGERRKFFGLRLANEGTWQELKGPPGDPLGLRLCRQKISDIPGGQVRSKLSREGEACLVGPVDDCQNFQVFRIARNKEFYFLFMGKLLVLICY
jgi:hypothetical protein